MTTGIDHFSNGAGAAPDGWTARLVTANVTYTEQATQPGYARAVITTQGRHMLSMDALGTSEANIDLCASMRTNAAAANDTTRLGLMARASGAAGTETGYSLTAYTTSGGVQQLRLGRYSAGTFVEGQTTPFTVAANIWYTLRLRCNGSTIQGKIWVTGTAEPTAWMVSYTNSDVTGPTYWHGWFPFYASTIDMNWFCYGTAGDVAPAAGYGYDDFGNGAGASPDGWTSRWVTANVTWTEQASGYARAAVTTSGRHLLARNLIDSVNPDIEMLVKCRRSATTVNDAAFMGLVARGSGAAAAENGYGVFFNTTGSTQNLRLNWYNAGTSTEITNVAFSHSANTWYWIRFRLIGTSLRVRAWADSGAEPGTWNIDTTHASVTAGGWNGLLAFIAPSDTDFGYFSWATDGGTAPSPAASGGVSDNLRLNGAYQGGKGAVSTWEAWLGATCQSMLSFGDDLTSWPNSLTKVNSNIADLANGPGGTGGRFSSWSIPLTITGVSLATVAAGDAAADNFFDNAAANILAALPSQTFIPIRIGWECNGPGFYPWYAVGNETNYINAFRRVVNRFRAVSSKFRFEWNVNWGENNDPTTFYPGDAYVDVIGMDCYYTPFDDSNGATAWAYKLTAAGQGGIGLNWLVSMGSSHSRPIAITEWGVDNSSSTAVSDNPGSAVYIENMAAFIRAQNVAWHHYWDENQGDGNHECKLRANEKSAYSGPRYILDFGAAVITNNTPVNTPAGSPVNIPLTTTSPAAVTWSFVSGTGGSVAGSTLTVSAQSAGTYAQVVRATNWLGYTTDKTINVVFGGSTATGFDDFTSGTATPPDGWTPRHVTSGVTWTEDAANSLARAAVTASGRHGLSMNAIDSVSADIEVLVKCRYSRSDNPSGAAYVGAIVRSSGVDTSVTGYAAFLNNTGGTDNFIINRYLGGVSVAIGTKTFSHSHNNWYWIRLRAIGDQIQASCWADGGVEPPTWDITVTNAEVTAAGWNGLFAFIGPATTGTINDDFDYFSYGTNGATAPSPAAGTGTYVEGDYEGALVSEGSSTVSGAAGSTPAVILNMRDCGSVPNENVDIGWWFFEARIENVNAKTPTFRVNIDSGGNPVSAMGRGWGDLPNDQTGPTWSYRVWFSYDNVTWTRFANTAEFGVGTSDHYCTFSHNAAFTSNTVYVAYGPRFPPSLLTSKVAALAGNAKVTMPAGWWDGISSVGANQFRIATTTATTDELGPPGRTIPAQPIYGFKISNGTPSSTKRKAVLTSGVHPCEQEAQISLWGAIDWLLAGSPEADAVLTRYDFWVIPSCNPSGVYGGFWRQDPHASDAHPPAFDSNRGWHTTSVECSNLVKPFLKTVDPAHVAFDYHCIGTNAHSGFFPSWMLGTGTIGNAWEAALVTAFTAMGKTPHVDYNVVGAAGFPNGYTPPGSLEGWMRNRMGALLATSVENGPYWKLTSSDWADYGQATMRALTTMYDDDWLEWREGSDLFNDNSGTVPNGWTTRWRTSASIVTWVEGASGYLTGTKITSPAERCALSLDTLNGEGDVEILIKARSPSNNAFANIQGPTVLLRGAGAALDEDGYRFSLQDASGTAKAVISKYLNGAGAALSGGTSEANFAWTGGTYYWLRARAQGNRLYLRVWQDGGEEPDAWTVEQTDSSFLTGWHGVFVSANNAGTPYPTDFDAMSWATAGARAPVPSAISVTPTNVSATQSFSIGQTSNLHNAPPVTGRPIRSVIESLDPIEVVDMFVYDDTNIGGLQTVRWHPGTTITGTNIVWQGYTYSAFPIEATGFTVQSNGPLPRPVLRASNIGGLLGAYLRTMKDAVGAKITRKRTLGKYLDAVNFPGGNPNADPTAAFPDEVYYIARKSSENGVFIEIELAVQFDVAGIKIPRRQIIAGTCQWIYRSPECGYSGPPVQDINGNPTSNPALDRCRKTLAACKARFGTNPLNTSAFPASNLMQP